MKYINNLSWTGYNPPDSADRDLTSALTATYETCAQNASKTKITREKAKLGFKIAWFRPLRCECLYHQEKKAQNPVFQNGGVSFEIQGSRDTASEETEEIARPNSIYS
jgi:hypothetical protein